MDTNSRIQDESPDLYMATFYWSQDMPLPVDLAAALIEQGYDVETLEAQHRP